MCGKVCVAHVIPLVVCMKSLFLYINAIFLQYHPSQLYNMYIYKLIPHIIDVHTRAHISCTHCGHMYYCAMYHSIRPEQELGTTEVSVRRAVQSTQKQYPRLSAIFCIRKIKMGTHFSNMQSIYTRRVYTV